MAKTIAVSDDVYEALSMLKLSNESFSDVIRKTLERGTRLSDIAGSKTVTREEWQKVIQAFEEQEALDEERKKHLLRG